MMYMMNRYEYVMIRDIDVNDRYVTVLLKGSGKDKKNLKYVLQQVTIMGYEYKKKGFRNNDRRIVKMN